MRKITKIWIIVAAVLILIGTIIFAGVMTVFKWDFTKLSTVKYVDNKYGITEKFNDISIDTDVADIEFIPSEDSKISVVLHEQEKFKHTVTVQDGALNIKINNTGKWYEFIMINFGSPKITVYLPKGEYGELSVKTSTGDTVIPKDFKFESIDVKQSTGNIKCMASAGGDVKLKTSTGSIKAEDIKVGSLSMTVSTGKVTANDIECAGDLTVKVSTGGTTLSNIKCNNLIANGSTGDIKLIKVIADEKINIKRSTGDIKFDGCDAGELIIETDTGDVKGTLLSEKVFIAKTDTGSVKVPESINGGKCKITTDTGDIKIEIK